MRLLMLVSSFLCGFCSVSFAVCPVVRGVIVPCGWASPAVAKEAPPAYTATYPSLNEQSLFTHEQVANDVTPEHLAVLNDPTWELAVMAAMVDLHRVQRAYEAMYLMDAAGRFIKEDIQAQTGLTQANFLPFLQAFAELWGLPVANLADVPAPTLPMTTEEETAKLLATALQQGRRAP